MPLPADQHRSLNDLAARVADSAHASTDALAAKMHELIDGIEVDPVTLDQIEASLLSAEASLDAARATITEAINTITTRLEHAVATSGISRQNPPAPPAEPVPPTPTTQVTPSTPPTPTGAGANAPADEGAVDQDEPA